MIFFSSLKRELSLCIWINKRDGLRARLIYIDEIIDGVSLYYAGCEEVIKVWC
jgi:hypothetical protein